MRRRTWKGGARKRRDGVKVVGTAVAIVFAGRWMLPSSVFLPGGEEGGATNGAFAPALGATLGTTQRGLDVRSGGGRLLLTTDGDVPAELHECSGKKAYDELRELSSELFIVGDALAEFVEFSRNSCPTKSDAAEALHGAIGLLIISIFIVLLVLAVVADAFFCPSVTNIVDDLRIPAALARVTLLPLGNGAPDVFAAIVAASKGSGEIGAGAIGGAALFVTSVVLGTVFVVAKPFRITPRAFLRDCSFFLIAIFLFLINARSRLIDPALGVFGLPCLYLVYICVVVYGEFSSRRKKNSGERQAHASQQRNENENDTSIDAPLLGSYDNDDNDDDNDESNDGSDNDEAAPYSVIDYYFRAVKVKTTFGQLAAVSHMATENDVEAPRRNVLEAPAILMAHEDSVDEEKERAKIRMQSRRRSISFDAGDMAFAREIEALQASANAAGDSWSPKSSTSDRAAERGNLLFPPSFASPSSSRSFDADDAEKADGEAGSSTSTSASSRDFVSNTKEEEPKSLLGADARLHIDERVGAGKEENTGIEMGARRAAGNEKDCNGVGGGTGMCGSDCADGDALASGLDALEFVWAVIEFPIYWAIAFLVPQPDPDKFSCWVAAINAFTLPLTATFFVSGILGLERGPSTIVLLYIASASLVVLAAPVYVLLRRFVKKSERDTTTDDGDAEVVMNASRTQRLRFTMTVLAFFTCIMLLSLTADVLVDYLVVLGKLLGIDSFTVGASILAWGNSAGDFLTDVTIARFPHAAPAAVAGAICGPFFNLSIGLGIALCILAGQSTSKTFIIPGSDNLGICLFIFLATSLVFTMTSIARTRFHSSRNVGFMLYVYYAVALGGLFALKRFAL